MCNCKHSNPIRPLDWKRFIEIDKGLRLLNRMVSKKCTCTNCTCKEKK